MPGDNENTAMPAGSTIITVINEMTGSIVDQLNNPGRATSEIDAKSLASADAIRLRVHKRVLWDWEIFCDGRDGIMGRGRELFAGYQPDIRLLSRAWYLLQIENSRKLDLAGLMRIKEQFWSSF